MLSKLTVISKDIFVELDWRKKRETEAIVHCIQGLTSHQRSKEILIVFQMTHPFLKVLVNDDEWMNGDEFLHFLCAPTNFSKAGSSL